jgi:hypothetical protein
VKLILLILLSVMAGVSFAAGPIQFTDESGGNPYGIRQTDNEPHVRAKIVNSSDTIIDLNVNESGQLKVVLDGKVSSINSTSTLLTSGAVFTGTGEETLDYAMIFVTVFADTASATDGLMTQVSSDNLTWRDSDSFTIPASTEKTFSFQTNKKYFRIKYTNGTSSQGVFDLHTVFKKTNSKPSSHRIADTISPQDDATLSKSVLTALNDNGNFTNINATASNNLKVANVENGLAIAKGDVSGSTLLHKFGDAPDFDISDGFVTIWDGANDGGINAMAYTYSATADITQVSSSNAADSTETEVQGLDSSYELTNQTVTLNGQNAVLLPTPLIRVFRAKNENGTVFLGDIYISTSGATLSSGVPTVVTEVRAVTRAEHQQTLMAIYTIPAGKTGYMRDWFVSASGAKKNSAHQIHLAARKFGGVFQTKHVSSIQTDGTSYIQHKYQEPEVFAEKTDIEMHANTDSDQAGIAAGFDIVLIDN